MIETSPLWPRIAGLILVGGVAALAGCSSPATEPNVAAVQHRQQEAKAKIEANDKLTPEQKRKALQIVGASGPGTSAPSSP